MTRLKASSSLNRRARLGVTAALVVGLTLPFAAHADHGRADDNLAALIGASILLAHYDAPRYRDHRYHGHNYRHAKQWRKYQKRHAYWHQDRRHDRRHFRHDKRHDLHGDRRGKGNGRDHGKRSGGHRRG